MIRSIAIQIACLLSDLAGNAFCSVNCMVAVVVGLAGIARGSVHSESAHNFNPFAECMPDSDSETSSDV